MNSRLRVFEQLLKVNVEPALEACQFLYDKSRTFRRSFRSMTQIIEFQVGVRFMAGRFTVNLGVYSPNFYVGEGTPPGPHMARESNCLPEYRERLGPLIETPSTSLFERVLGRGARWWRDAFPRADKWWRLSEDADKMRCTLEEVVGHIIGFGIPWLEARSDPLAMKECYDIVRSRMDKGI